MRADRGRADGRRELSAALFALAAVAIAAAAAWPIYETTRVVLLAAVAGGVGVALGLLATRMRRGALIAAAGLPAAYLVLVVPLAVPSAMTSPTTWLVGVRDGVAGLVLGWKQLLTLPTPVGDYQAVLVPLFAIVLLGGFGVAAFAARPGRSAVLAVPIALVMSGFGPLFGPSGLGASLAVGPARIPGAALVGLGIAAVILCLVWLSVRARLERFAAIERAAAAGGTVSQARVTGVRLARSLMAGALAIVAIVAGVAIAPVAAELGDRASLRDRVDPMVVLSRTESPLSDYRRWFAGAAFDTTVLQVAGADGLDRLRFATLTRFDGVRFTVDGSTAGRFSRIPTSARAPGDVEVTVTLGDGWSGPWLPMPGIVTAAPVFAGGADLADGLAVAPGGVTAIAVVGTTEQDAVGPGPGTVYTVAGQPLAEAATVIGGTDGGPSLLADAMPQLADWVELQGVPSTGDGLLELVQRLRDRGALSHARVEDAAAAGWIAALAERADYSFEPSMAGHGTARIEELFAALTRQQVLAGADADPSLLVAGVGDEEQFATAVALLARHLGFDSRVVVGVRLATDEPLSSVAPCVDGVCTGANVTAWVEVLGDGGQWGVIDVGPQFAVPITRVAEGEILPEHPTTPQRPESELVDPPVSQLGETDAAAGDEPGDGTDWLAVVLPIARIVGLVIAAIVLLLLPAIVLAVAKSARRGRRRRAAPPEAAVVGAWEELIDGYVDRGMLVGDRGPRSWTAEHAARPAAVGLAGLVDAAVFADAPVTDADRTAAWSIVDGERAALRAQSGPFARLGAMLTPRSLVRHLADEPVEPTTLEVGRERTAAPEGDEG